jgi:hypothetical protein
MIVYDESDRISRLAREVFEPLAAINQQVQACDALDNDAIADDESIPVIVKQIITGRRSGTGSDNIWTPIELTNPGALYDFRLVPLPIVNAAEAAFRNTGDPDVAAEAAVAAHLVDRQGIIDMRRRDGLPVWDAMDGPISPSQERRMNLATHAPALLRVIEAVDNGMPIALALEKYGANDDNREA